MSSRSSALDLNRAIQTNSQILSVLFAAKQSFEDIFLNWEEPIAIVDMSGRIFYFNYEWSYFFTLDSEEIRGHSLHEVLDFGQKEVLSFQLSKVLKGQKEHIECETTHQMSGEYRTYKWAFQKHDLSDDFSVVVVRAKDMSKVKAYQSEARLTSVLERLCRMKRDFIFAKSIQDIGLTFFQNVIEHLAIQRVGAATLRVVDFEDQQEALDFLNEGVLGSANQIDHHSVDSVRAQSQKPIEFRPGRLILPIREFGVAKLSQLPENFVYDVRSQEFLTEACQECSTSIRSFLHLQYDLEKNQIQNENKFIDGYKRGFHEDFKKHLDWEVQDNPNSNLAQVTSSELARNGSVSLIFVEHKDIGLEDKMVSRYFRGRVLGLSSILREKSDEDQIVETIKFLLENIQSSLEEAGRNKDSAYLYVLSYNPGTGDCYIVSNTELDLQDSQGNYIQKIECFTDKKPIVPIQLPLNINISVSASKLADCSEPSKIGLKLKG